MWVIGLVRCWIFRNLNYLSDRVAESPVFATWMVVCFPVQTPDVGRVGFLVCRKSLPSRFVLIKWRLNVSLSCTTEATPLTCLAWQHLATSMLLTNLSKTYLSKNPEEQLSLFHMVTFFSSCFSCCISDNLQFHHTMPSAL